MLCFHSAVLKRPALWKGNLLEAIRFLIFKVSLIRKIHLMFIFSHFQGNADIVKCANFHQDIDKSSFLTEAEHYGAPIRTLWFLYWHVYQVVIMSTTSSDALTRCCANNEIILWSLPKRWWSTDYLVQTISSTLSPKSLCLMCIIWVLYDFWRNSHPCFFRDYCPYYCLWYNELL